MVRNRWKSSIIAGATLLFVSPAFLRYVEIGKIAGETPTLQHTARQRSSKFISPLRFLSHAP
jgi:hypothetical protein